MNKKYCVSCSKFTIIIEVNNNDIITDISPVSLIFKGQTLESLFKWINKNFGKYECILVGE